MVWCLSYFLFLVPPACCLTPFSSIDVRRWDVMTEWIRSAGGHVSPLFIGPSPVGGRGLFTEVDIRPGDVIIAYPRSLNILGDAARAVLLLENNDAIADFVRRASSLPSGNTWITGMLLAMERRKGSASFYYPYIAQLPHSYPTLPPYPPEVLEEAGGGYWIAKGGESAPDGQNRSEKEMIEFLKGKKGLPVTPEEVLWGMRSTQTRAWGLSSTLHTNGHTNLLSPGLDMFNHGPAPACGVDYTERDNTVLPFTYLRCHTAVPAGAEVFVSYGMHAAYARLFTFGFISSEDRASVLLHLVGNYKDHYSATLRPGSAAAALWRTYEAACVSEPFTWSTGPLTERSRACLLLYAVSAARDTSLALTLSSPEPAKARLVIKDPAPGLMGAAAWYILNTLKTIHKKLNKHGDTDISALQKRIDNLPRDSHPALPFILQARILDLRAFHDLEDEVLRAFGVSSFEASIENAREHLADLRPAPMALLLAPSTDATSLGITVPEVGLGISPDIHNPEPEPTNEDDTFKWDELDGEPEEGDEESAM